MEPSQLAQALPTPDACPPTLRLVVEAWKRGQATNQDLIEASFAAGLDLLSNYRWRPLPTPPEAVEDYRALGKQTRQEMSEESRTKLLRGYASWYAQEDALIRANASNLHWLTQVVAWAQAKGLLPAVVEAVRAAQRTHRQTSEPMEEPVLL